MRIWRCHKRIVSTGATVETARCAKVPPGFYRVVERATMTTTSVGTPEVLIGARLANKFFPFAGQNNLGANLYYSRIREGRLRENEELEIQFIGSTEADVLDVWSRGIDVKLDESYNMKDRWTGR